MTPDITIGVLALQLVGLAWFLMWSIRQMHSEREGFRLVLELERKYTKQLLDRIATYEFAKNDAMIPRMHAATPPSVKEEQIAGPHGRSRNTVAVPAEKPTPPRKTRTFKVDTGEEFGGPKE